VDRCGRPGVRAVLSGIIPTVADGVAADQEGETMTENDKKRPLIIAFGHRKRVGKNVAAKEAKRYLVHRYGYDSRRVWVCGFADELKRICADLYGWAGMRHIEWYEDYPEDRDEVLPAIGKTPRQIWIDFGTKAVREHVYASTWCDYLLRRDVGDSTCAFVISDLRFPDEFEAVKKRGGLCVKLVREPYVDDADVADLALEDETRWGHSVTAASGDVDALKAGVRDAVDLAIQQYTWLDQADAPGLWPRY